MSMGQNSEYVDRVVDFYEQNSEDFFTRTVNLDMTALYDQFLPLIPAGGTILDAGCGSGRDTLYFKSLGYKVSAFDASQGLSDLATQVVGFPVRKLSFHKMDYYEEFDGVWCCASLLHLNDEDLKNTFIAIHRAIRFDGLCFQSFKSSEPKSDSRYFNIMNLEGLVNRIKGSGLFQVIEAWESEDVRPDQQSESWANVIVKKIR